MTSRDDKLLALGIGTFAAGAVVAYFFLRKKDASSSSESKGVDLIGPEDTGKRLQISYDPKNEPECPQSPRAVKLYYQDSAPYFPSLSDGERAMLEEYAPKERVMHYLNSIQPRALKLYKRWMDWAAWKWGPSGFSASVPADKRQAFEDDKIDFYTSFLDWYERERQWCQWRYASFDTWKKRYAEYTTPSLAQMVPGYWRHALSEMFDDARRMNFAEAIFKKKLAESPEYAEVGDTIAKK